MLGVNAPGDRNSEDYRILPPSLKAAWDTRVDESRAALFGDYLVCPFTKTRPGWMRFVCVAKARRVVAAPP